MIDSSFFDKILADHLSCSECAAPSDVKAFFEGLLQLLFSDLAEEKLQSIEEIELRIVALRAALALIAVQQGDSPEGAKKLEKEFFDQLPRLRELILEDAKAIEAGDPAALNINEVIRTYPGFYAIAAHRMAHQLWTQGILIVPRIISEIAHTRTGVDIHPAADIGRHFCIDHGTGIVIGATSTIGDHVKIYQGVTLGALSVRKEDATKKRHPTIEDHCVLYSGATILGGETVIGRGSIIGGNVWITKSVEPGSKIYYQAKIHDGQKAKADFVLYKSEE